MMTSLYWIRSSAVFVKRQRSVCALALVVALGSIPAEAATRQVFQPADIHRIQTVSDLAIAPDGEWVAYQVGSTHVDTDKSPSDLFMVSWDGKTRIQLTHTEDSKESHPRFSPDGRFLAFIAARTDGQSDETDDPKAKSQVWLLNRAGGEAKRLTEMPDGVTGFEWAPDSTRLVIVAKDPEEEDTASDDEEGPSHDTPKPIVIDRYQFKQDKVGYLGDRYQRLYIYDLESNDAVLLTPGKFDSSDPRWAPDGKRITFTSKRQGDPDRNGNSDIYVIDAVEGATAQQITRWDGPDSDPMFSPDGKWIAYLQGGPAKYAGYDPAQLAVVSAEGGEPILPTAALDRASSAVRWSPDGKQLYFLFVDDRSQFVASVPFKGGEPTLHYPGEGDPGVVSAFEVGPNGAAVVASFGQRPAEIYRAHDGTALSDHNRELLDTTEFATVEGYDAVSKDGTRVGAMLLKPPGFRKGVRYPTIAYVHGGPTSQDGFEFDATSQALAAQGYLVVNPNYRGSTGRGRDFSRIIYADWGNLEIQDIHALMDKLVADGLADPEKLGIGGWSYGGMSTNYAIATDTRFKAAVSGAGIANAITGYGTDQYIRQYENEIGLPWESLDPYIKISYPFLHADRIKTPTLFMCGEKDFNVPLINSEQMYQALRSLEVPTQLIIYPGQYHGLAKPSYVEDRLRRMIDWYGRYLK